MKYFLLYHRVVLYPVRFVALAFVAVSIILSIVILCDFLLRLNWRYPWWSLFLTPSWIVIGYLLNRAAQRALESARQ